MNARARILRLERAARRGHDCRRPLYFEGGRLCGGGGAALNMADLRKSFAAWEAADKSSSKAKPSKVGRR